jgi:putative ABC transport system ATP-binding protein
MEALSSKGTSPMPPPYSNEKVYPRNHPGHFVSLTGLEKQPENRMALETAVDTTVSNAAGPHPGDVIVTDNLWKTYEMGDQEVHALRGVNLRIRHNEYVAIMGPSGSGKSTLMNLIGCLDSPSQGKYWLNGHDVSELNDDELARIRNKEIGFVFQTFNLLARATALHNVELPLIYNGTPAAERDQRAKAALDSVGLGTRMLHKPNELSGGQRQRVAIARALINNPSIILADEPTGNLDSKTGDEIMALFDELHARGNTIVLVTHEPDIAEFAHRVVTIRDGVIASDQASGRIRT